MAHLSEGPSANCPTPEEEKRKGEDISAGIKGGGKRS